MEENLKKSYPIRNRIKAEDAIRNIELWLDNEEDSVTESESEAEFSENESVEYARDELTEDPVDIEWCQWI